MNRFVSFAALALAAAITTSSSSAFAQAPKRVTPQDSFASDLQTVAVMSNVTGVGGAQFTSYVAIFNPTTAAFPVSVTLWDANGTRHDAIIQLAAGEQKTYTNFLADVFSYTGGGSVTFQSGESIGGTHNNRFIVNAEVRTGRYGTLVPVSNFAASSSRSFSPGISVDSTSRTNVGCINQASTGNTVTATVFDKNATQVGVFTLSLAANAWGQTGVTSVVSDGYVRFDPTDTALCYAVVVDNSTNDGRFIPSAEYQP